MVKIEALIQRVKARRAGWVKYRVTVYRIEPTAVVLVCRSRPLRYRDALMFARQHTAEIVHNGGELLALATETVTTTTKDCHD